MLKNRKKPTDHRQGKLVKLLDFIQRFSNMYHDDNFYDIEAEQINHKYQEELEDMMRELREFDITEIGDLYLTSGGRVVLDKGYGEYFREADEVIYTLKQLTSGIPVEEFLKDISSKLEHKALEQIK